MAKNQDDNTQESLSEEQNSDGGKAGSDELSLKQLEGVLGKEFPDKETALKSIKDTYQYVGKAGKAVTAMETFQKEHGLTEDEALAVFKEAAVKATTQEEDKKSPVDEDKYVTRDEMDRMSFYSDRPEYKKYKELIDQLKRANPDKAYDEVVEMDSFNTLFEGAKAQAEAEKKKSVLRSSPRLGEVKDTISDAKKAQSEGRQSEANQKAVDAVIDAFNLRG